MSDSKLELKVNPSAPPHECRGLLRIDPERRSHPRLQRRGLAPSNGSINLKAILEAGPISPPFSAAAFCRVLTKGLGYIGGSLLNQLIDIRKTLFVNIENNIVKIIFFKQSPFSLARFALHRMVFRASLEFAEVTEKIFFGLIS